MDASVFTLEVAEESRLVIFDDVEKAGFDDLASKHRNICNGSGDKTIHRKCVSHVNIIFPPILITTNLAAEEIPISLRTRMTVINVLGKCSVSYTDNAAVSGSIATSIAFIAMFGYGMTVYGQELNITEIKQTAFAIKDEYTDMLTQLISLTALPPEKIPDLPLRHK